MKKSCLLFVLSLSLFAFDHPAGFHAYVTFTGSKQGEFKGESTSAGRKDNKGKAWYEVVAFDAGGELAADAVRTVAAGKRQHKQFTLTKGIDGATPKLALARQTTELLESVVIQTANDQNQVTGTITLKNALITNIKTNGNTETLSFSYDSMTQ